MIELVGICDTVFHLAAAVGVKYILDNPLSSITTNILGTEIVLKLANKFKKKVLIASTSEAYGKQEKAPLVETDNVTFGSSGKARWSYAVAKLMDEFTAIAYNKTTQLPVVVVRFFNTVGPKQTGEYGMVIPNFVKQALRNTPITVHGDGTQRRTFTHVSEVTDCIMKLIDTPEAYGEVVNIGGVEEVTIKELAQKIIDKSNSKSEIKLVPYEEVYSDDFEDMPRRVPSTEKLKSLIGFTPQKGLDEILEDIIEDFQVNARQFQNQCFNGRWQCVGFTQWNRQYLKTIEQSYKKQ
eukprot:TRINITY_DN80153_c0_g1_i1.p1 TRINITY_DN80153_c0_g1~~TRINITY_DN80153_c0_g1_i1.p1  ORF type:complete len:337 (-),score=7.92 TRINITY_DN80153_c0_g1_i1:60-944(-)